MPHERGSKPSAEPTRSHSRKADSGDSAPNGVRMVVGANRGIGLALVEAQLRDPGVQRVIATHRPTANLKELDGLAETYGEKLLPQPLDVSSESSMDGFARFLASLEGGIDLTIHAAGILHEDGMQPEKSLGQCDPSGLLRMFRVNAIGPLMVARALMPTLRRDRPFVFAAISAMVGSIGDNRLGGWYGYRASKAALNQFVRTLANECRVRHPSGAIVSVHPGTTDTGLSRPFQKNVDPQKLASPRQTAQRILALLNSVDAGRSGRFLHWDGSTIPW